MTLVELDGLAADRMDEVARFSRAHLEASNANEIDGLATHQRLPHRTEQSALYFLSEVFEIERGP